LKICKHCGTGFEGRCALCHARYQRNYRKRNPEKARAINRKAYHKWCKANPEERRRQSRESAAKRRKEDPDVHRRAQIKHTLKKLGTDPESVQPEPKFCECCGRLPNAGKRLCIDHSHDTNKFRGWLCNNCNGGIGMLGDTLEGVQNAINYLTDK